MTTKEQILVLAGEPVGVFADVNKLTPEHGQRWEHMVDESFDGVDYVHLYTADQVLAARKPLEFERDVMKADIAFLNQQLAAANAEIERLKSPLQRIVSYYDLAKNGSSLPSMTMQARAEHENTMFGEARKALNYGR